MSIVNIVVLILSILTMSFYYFRRVLFLTHMFQNEEYKDKNFIVWKNENIEKLYPKTIRRFVLFAPSMYFFSIVIALLTKFKVEFIIFSVFCSVYLYFCHTKPIKNPKKPLKYTARIKRLLVTNIILYFLFLAVITVYIVLNYGYAEVSWMSGILLIGVFYYMNFSVFKLSYKINEPIENRIKKHYYNMAKSKMNQNTNITVVGITGSYGKTSTKFFLSQLLENNMNLLKTPASFNTPMGISKVINNNLKGDEDVFVVEMGARQKGDIEELCVLTPPKYGIITSIGAAHLQTFGNIKTVMETKYELIESLPSDGIAIFNIDNKYSKELYDNTKIMKMGYSILGNADVYATEIEVFEKGSKFMLHIKDKGSVKCDTKVLGKHNILNILAGVCVAAHMDLSLEKIKESINLIEPVEHRLQLIDPGTNALVIDDAFNSNPDGAKAALEVLNGYKNRKKIIVTPGMIELGEFEYDENYKFGLEMSKACDIIILIGEKRTKPIQKGVKENGFDDSNLFVVNSLDEATKILMKFANENRIILFENDLPDSLSEV